MTKYRFWVCLVLLCGSPALFAQQNSAPQKYALVIGNGSYRNIEQLANPVNDATDMAAGLRRLGFQVDLKLNLGNAEMGRAIADYAQRLGGGNRQNEGFFWYAGHGVQLEGENYLLPVDISARDTVDIQYGSYPLSRLLLSLEQTARNKLNVVVLDACRNNPFKNLAGGGRAVGRGLSVVNNLPQDLFILFSTAAGDIAADGDRGRRNSPFAEAFLKYMESPEAFAFVIADITRETLRLTDNRQRPFQQGSIISEKYYSLNPRPAAQAARPVPAPVPAPAIKPQPAPAPAPQVQPAARPQDAAKGYKIGDIGPAGGWVFYDKGSYSDGWRYLEAAPRDVSEVEWDLRSRKGVGARETAVGTGKSNTHWILRSGGTGKAAQLCAAFEAGGFREWFLPSKDELDLMYKNLKARGLGNFQSAWFYWSSSEWYDESAWRQRFSDGYQDHYSKNNAYSVRPVRAF